MFLAHVRRRLLLAPLRPGAPAIRYRFRPAVERLEDRAVPALLGLAQQSLNPDIASGVKTSLSYTQLGNNANPFHYDATPLTVTLGDGTRYTLSNPTGGTRKTVLDLRLDNAGGFAGGAAGPDFSVTGRVVIDGKTYDNTLLTGEVREFGHAVTGSMGEFEVRVVVTGGSLAGDGAQLRAGTDVALLIHQPGMPVGSFPASFALTSLAGVSDAKKVSARITNTNPLAPGYECDTGGLPAATFGDPQDTGGSVSPGTGAVYQQVVPLTIPGRGLDYQLALTYRSDVQSAGALGHNWDMNYLRRLVQVTTRNLTELRGSFTAAQVGDVVRIDGANRADLYPRQPDGSYTPPGGSYTQLTRKPDGSFAERDQAGTVYTYTKPDGTGTAVMTSTADRNNDTLRFQYDPLGRLSQVVDTLGRPVVYAYDDRSQLATVTDYSGRTVRFQYDARGDLTGITTPAVTGTPTGNDFPAGRTTRYTYSSGYTDERLNHNLLTVVAPNEVADGSLTPRVRYTYDTNPSSPTADRVQTEALGGTNAQGVPAGGTIRYAYTVLPAVPTGDYTTPAARTAVTDRNGNVTRYDYNRLGNIVRTEEFTNRDVRPGDPPSFVTTYQYDRDYRLLTETRPQGNTAQYTYDAGNPDRFQQGNRLSATTLPDARGGDQAAITTSYTYEPVYNQVRTVTEPLGNDPAYVPQNGGANSPARYTTTFVYDYQEGTNFAAIGALLGISAAQAAARLAAAGVPMGLGDVNGDGRTDQVRGNLVRVVQPTAHLLAGSNQAAVEGTTLQPIVTTYAYNDFGQLTRQVDPERNVTQFSYFPERDPNGDGVIDYPAGDPATGGYLWRVTQDTASDPARNSGTNPPPVGVRHTYQYDAVGNLTRDIDGRGVATGYTHNPLNEVVQVTRGAAVGLYGPDPGEPLPLTAFQYAERYFYDANGNVVLTQREDRGNTSGVDGNVPAADRPSFAPDPDPAGGPAYADTVYKYDILDQRIETLREAGNGAAPEFLRTRYRYDPNGNAALTIEPAGNAAATVYDERDLVYQTTTGAATPPAPVLLGPGDPTGYDARGGLPAAATYHYDANRNLIEAVDADDTDGAAGNASGRGGAGDRTRYQYDGFDRRTSVVDAVGNQTVFQYDPAGNVVRVSAFGPVGGPSPTANGPADPAGPVSSGGVVQPGNLVTTNLLSATEYSYDELKRPYQTDRVLFVNTTPTARPPDVADGSLTPGDTQPIPGVAGVTILGRVTARTEYDRNSRPTFAVADDGATTRTFYDGVGRAVRVIDPEGNSVETAYDAANNVVETRETDVSQVPGVTDEVFLTTTFYDSLGRPQRAVDNLGRATEYRYDSRDNLVSAADATGPVTGATITRRAFPDGPRTVDAVNDYGNVTRYSYDGLDRRTRVEQVLTPSGKGDGTHVGASLYGVKDDPTVAESFAPAGDPAQGGGDGLIRTGYVYDADSFLSARLDDQGNVTLFLYDNLGRRVVTVTGLTTASGPLTAATVLNGRPVPTPTASTANNPATIPTARIDAQLAPAAARLAAVSGLFSPLADRTDDSPPTTTVYGYDPDGNVLIRVDENGSATYTRYDALDRPIAARVFRAGQSDSFAGDPVYAPVPVVPPASTGTTGGTTRQDFQYDGLSRLTRATDDNDPTAPPDDATLTFAYDSLGRVIEEGQQVGGLPPAAVSSAWRADNQRTRLTYPNGRVVTYTYDGLDRIDTVSDLGAADPIADYDYIGPDRVLERRAPLNGTRATFLNDAGTADLGYDGLGRPVQLRDLRADGSLIVGFTYAYDRAGNRLTAGKLHDPANSESYTYDSAYRLTGFARDPGGQPPLQGQWTLDGAGNWTQVGAETRQYSSTNELIQTGATSILYDANGNQTDDGTFLFGYDALNRLRTVVRKADGLAVAVYAYDAVGRRVRKVVTNSGPLDGTTTFYYDGAHEIEERDRANALTRQYVLGAAPDEVLVFDANLDSDGSATGPGDRRLFYHQDPLQSAFALTDTTGKVVEGYQYDAFGRQTVFGPGADGVVNFGGDDVVTPGGVSAVGNPYLFTGRRLDAETGLYDYRARTYNPVQGRFLQRDPAGGEGNLYEYAGGNPINVTDPTGRAGARPGARVVSDWTAQSKEGNYTVKVGTCCREVTLFYTFEERVVEERNIYVREWRNLLFTHYLIGGPVACTGSEVGELVSPGGPWRWWRPPIARSGRSDLLLSPVFREAPPTGTEAPGGGYAPQMLGD